MQVSDVAMEIYPDICAQLSRTDTIDAMNLMQEREVVGKVVIEP